MVSSLWLFGFQFFPRVVPYEITLVFLFFSHFVWVAFLDLNLFLLKIKVVGGSVLVNWSLSCYIFLDYYTSSLPIFFFFLFSSFEAYIIFVLDSIKGSLCRDILFIYLFHLLCRWTPVPPPVVSTLPLRKSDVWQNHLWLSIVRSKYIALRI